ncbi:hypothetical protein J4E85_003729 [Alternaria conjuncta]|uniref:uncharacterized protein n=1 Tax=Alternaria conjuncta TaxID=181017 RepID=UPI00221ED4F5|nr:uncharacterized protein J4E85_003729 [Alternaria conjuncta]KAI4931140.1 hypothetical protein J4E85_003729 [Alternaria conjuncta]
MAEDSHLQQHFSQGLGNGGDGPPNERQHDNPQRGHYAESLRPIVVRDHQKSANGMRFGEYQEPGYHVGYQNSSYGAEHLESRLQEQEQRLEAAMTTMQQQATAITTLQQKHEQLRREHLTLVHQLNAETRRKPAMATQTVPETVGETPVEQALTDGEQFLALQRARYPDLDMGPYGPPRSQQTLPLHQAQQSLPVQQTPATGKAQPPPQQLPTGQRLLTQARIKKAAGVPLSQEHVSQPALGPAQSGFLGDLKDLFEPTGVDLFAYGGYILPPPRQD